MTEQSTEAGVPSLVERLRNYDECNDSDVDEAADMLEFVFSLMQVTSAKMDGQHLWRFAGGWPMTRAKGQTPEAAIRTAMEDARRSAK